MAFSLAQAPGSTAIMAAAITAGPGPTIGAVTMVGRISVAVATTTVAITDGLVSAAPTEDLPAVAMAIAAIRAEASAAATASTVAADFAVGEAASVAEAASTAVAVSTAAIANW